MKNKELAKIFKQAKKLIKNRESDFICYAIDEIEEGGHIYNANMCDTARNLIHKRMWTSHTLEGWLSWYCRQEFHWLVYSKEGKKQMRLYRLRWLDSLITEFS